jgi:superkiller protein 3
MDITGKKRSNVMKKITFLVLLVSLGAASLQAQKKTFTREYTYPASEADSKLTARANATTQMRNILLRELGEFLHAERVLIQNATTQDYSEKIEAITAGIVEMKTLDERWDGTTYYIKAEMAVDPKNLERRIAETLNDKQKTQELEEARKRTLAAEAEIERLKKELAATKNEPQRLDLKTKYQQTADALSAEEYFTKATNAQENGFSELAIEYFQKTVEIDPNNVEAYFNMGNANADVKNYHEAIRCFQKVIDMYPGHSKAYNNMGIAYYKSHARDKAFRYFQKAVELDPNNAAAFNNMGLVHGDLGNHDEAIRCFQKAIALDLKDVAYYSMGMAYYNLKKYLEAARCFQKVVEAEPNNGLAYNWMASSYFWLTFRKYNKEYSQKERWEFRKAFTKHARQAKRLGHPF